MFNFSCCTCQHTFEKLEKSSVAVATCPNCGNDAEKTVSAPTAFKFNGSGFYETDFKSKK